MKRCKCGCDTFMGLMESREWWGMFDSGDGSIELGEPGDIQSCDFIGPFICDKCRESYANWEDIPDAD